MIGRRARRHVGGWIDRVGRAVGAPWAMPYPVPASSVPPPVPVAPDAHAVFDSAAAAAINLARLAHLRILDLPLSGARVLDVGAGPGHLARGLADLGCDVVCVDGREENVLRIRSGSPPLPAHVADVQADRLRDLGEFEVVFCYGLLYHLESPLAGLHRMAEACSATLLLETMVCDAEAPLLRMEREPVTPNQALQGIGCRPSPSWVVAALEHVGFPFVYAPRTPPEHPDFRFGWRGDHAVERDGHPLRCVFVASRTRRREPQLVELLPRARDQRWR